MPLCATWWFENCNFTLPSTARPRSPNRSVLGTAPSAALLAIRAPRAAFNGALEYGGDPARGEHRQGGGDGRLGDAKQGEDGLVLAPRAAGWPFRVLVRAPVAHSTTCFAASAPLLPKQRLASQAHSAPSRPAVLQAKLSARGPPATPAVDALAQLDARGGGGPLAEEASGGGEKATLRQSVFTMVNAVLGAGVLGYPFCFKVC